MSDLPPSIFDIKWRYEAYREQEHQRGRTGVTPVSPGEFDRWHAAELRKAKAEAWDEALWNFAGQVDEVQSMWIEAVTNPYRADQDQGE